MPLNLMAQRSAELFAKCFGHAPRWIVAAPGRVNLIGEHTDYNDGFVLPMAIERHVVIAADRNSDHEALVHSMTTGETAHFGCAPGRARKAGLVELRPRRRRRLSGARQEGRRVRRGD